MLHRAQNKENKMDFSVAWSVRKMGTDLMSDRSKSAFIMARRETFCGCFFPSAVWVSEWHLRSRQRWSAPTLQSAVSLSRACQKAASFWGLLTAPFMHFFFFTPKRRHFKNPFKAKNVPQTRLMWHPLLAIIYAVERKWLAEWNSALALERITATFHLVNYRRAYLHLIKRHWCCLRAKWDNFSYTP